MRKSCAVVALAASSAFGQCEEQTLALGGALGDIALIDGYAVAFGQGVYRAFDVSDIHAPALAVSIDMNLAAGAARVIGDLAYVVGARTAMGDVALTILDVADPLEPVILGSLDGLDDYSDVQDLAVANGHAYIVTGEGGDLLIVNVFDPTAPTFVDAETAPDAFAIEFIDDKLYMCRGKDGDLTVYDISNPTNLVHELDFDDIEGAGDVVRHGARAYVPTLHGLAVLNVATPGAPVLLDEVDIDGFLAGVDVTIISHYACVSSAYSPLAVVDVQNPADLQVAGMLDESTSFIRYNGLSVIAATRAGEFATIDVADITEPTVAARLVASGKPGDVERLGDLAFVLSETELFVFDLAGAAPSYPLAVLHLPIDETERFRLEGGGDLVFAVTDEDVFVVDVADPANPAVIGGITTGQINDVALDGDHLYLARPSGLLTIDVSDPALPAVDGFLVAPGANAIDLDGDHAYLVSVLQLFVADVADPAAPVLTATLPIDFSPIGVGADDGLAVVMRGADDAFHILDVADPAAPTIIATVVGGLFDYRFGAELRDGLAYVEGNLEWEAWDLTDPTQPLLVGHLDRGAVSRLDFHGDSVSVSTLHPVVEYDMSACTPCPVDVNDDGVLNILDFVAFQLLWKAGDPGADCDDDGELTVLDFVCFQSQFIAGC